MSKVHKQNFLQGAMILGVSALLVKAIGAFFKVPLANILGGTGMGYFMTAYDLFNPIRALAIAGIPVAVSKIVAENIAVGRHADAKRTFKSAVAVMCITGVLGTVLLYVTSGFFANAVGNANAAPAIAAMSPAIFFCCMVSAYRGYYEGMRNMYPTAISQVFEAVVKLICGIALANITMAVGYEQYLSTGMVFGSAAATVEEAVGIITPITAAAAMLGISISTLGALLFLMARHGFGGGDITAQELRMSPTPRPVIKTMSGIAEIAVPVCLGSLTVNIASMVDLFSVMNRLADAVAKNPEPFIGQYGFLLGDGVTLAGLPNYLYGSYTGLALTIFNIVPALTVVFGISALPTISSAWVVRNKVQTQKNIEAVLRIVSIIAIPAGLGISAMSRPILMLFFPSRLSEIAVVTELLEVLGLAVVFVSLQSPINSILQAVGRADVPVKLMAVGTVIKILVNYIFIGIPQVNIAAAPYGTLLCYGFIIIASLFVLMNTTGIKISVMNTFIKPTIAGLCCALTARNAYKIMFGMAENQIITLLSIGIGAIIYLVLLFILKIVTKDDIIMLPYGKKILKGLEKIHFIS